MSTTDTQDEQMNVVHDALCGCDYIDGRCEDYLAADLGTIAAMIAQAERAADRTALLAEVERLRGQVETASREVHRLNAENDELRVALAGALREAGRRGTR